MSIDGFRQVIADVPSRKDDGSAFTEADLGSGGYRNSDGTLSALAQNLRYFDGEDDVEKSPSDDNPNGDGDSTDEIGLLIAAAAGAALVTGGGILAWQNRADIAEGFNARVSEPLKARWRTLRNREESSAELTSLLDAPHDDARPTITRVQEQQLRDEAAAAMHVLQRNARVLNSSDVIEDGNALPEASTPAELEAITDEHRIDAVLSDSEHVEPSKERQAN